MAEYVIQAAGCRVIRLSIAASWAWRGQGTGVLLRSGIELAPLHDVCSACDAFETMTQKLSSIREQLSVNRYQPMTDIAGEMA